MADIQIYNTSEELYDEAARIFLQAGAKALRHQGQYSVALSGGSTPLPLYRKLAQDQAADSLHWDKVHFFWGDERTVSPDHPDSNYREAFQSLLKPRAVPGNNIHRVRGELDPNIAAREYERDLLGWFDEIPPRFDLILLGLGSDGHTASLFPGTRLVESSNSNKISWVHAVYVSQLQSWRITFTAPLINAASLVLFLVVGANKARALKEVLHGAYHPEAYPAQLIQPKNERLIWLVDKEAAIELDT